MQIDGSHHPWLEERGPKFVLLLAVDDATGVRGPGGLSPKRRYSGLPGAAGGPGPAVGNSLGTVPATGMRPSNTMPARGPYFTSPPSSPG